MAMKIRPLTKDFAVSPQVHVGDVQKAAQAGYRVLVNNRPDGEMWGQPKGDAIAQAAQEHGLQYHALPISLRGLNPDQIGDLQNIIKDADGPVLAFCNTGTRSSTLWALAQAGIMDADEIIAAARAHGYNLAHLRDYLVQAGK